MSIYKDSLNSNRRSALYGAEQTTDNISSAYRGMDPSDASQVTSMTLQEIADQAQARPYEALFDFASRLKPSMNAPNEDVAMLEFVANAHGAGMGALANFFANKRDVQHQSNLAQYNKELEDYRRREDRTNEIADRDYEGAVEFEKQMRTIGGQLWDSATHEAQQAFRNHAMTTGLYDWTLLTSDKTQQDTERLKALRDNKPKEDRKKVYDKDRDVYEEVTYVEGQNPVVRTWTPRENGAVTTLQDSGVDDSAFAQSLIRPNGLIRPDMYNKHHRQVLDLSDNIDNIFAQSGMSDGTDFVNSKYFLKDKDGKTRYDAKGNPIVDPRLSVLGGPTMQYLPKPLLDILYAKGDERALLDYIGKSEFLTNVDKMRGMGALTDREGAKLQGLYEQAMDPNLNYNDRAAIIGNMYHQMYISQQKLKQDNRELFGGRDLQPWHEVESTKPKDMSWEEYGRSLNQQPQPTQPTQPTQQTPVPNNARDRLRQSVQGKQDTVSQLGAYVNE